MKFDLLVHATHEAGVKVGGIGAVLDGLLSARAYNEHVSRTVLIGPINTRDTTEMERLATPTGVGSPHNQLQIDYSSYHAVDRLDANLGDALRSIELAYNAKLLYGRRTFGSRAPGSPEHEVILVDGTRADLERTNAYKSALYRHFGIESDRYESHPEFSQHLNAAEPGYLALQAVTREAGPQRFIIAHEFMGMPLCYSAILRRNAADPGGYRTVFYGHEVATVRPIVESHPGHDTMFYNVLARARSQGLYLADIFGNQSGFFKDALIRPAATHCDNILAVGDSVVDEMRFLDATWEQANIDLVYNGVPSYQITVDDKRISRDRLKQYCVNLLGYRPDHVFTHVTRFVPSKGLWRDLRVMEQLDPLLDAQGRSAVLFILSTTIPVGRPVEAILKMESRYGWPVRHRERSIHINGQDVPDLVSHEIPFYRAIARFNRSAHATKVVFVNQFGWSQDRCGVRMPEAMEFDDIRTGSDVEFGQSIYEPFGIAQVEPLSFGALCVISSVCGCVGFLDRVGGLDKDNVVIADYVAHAVEQGASVETALAIDRSRRDQIEAEQARAVARLIVDRLPRDDTAAHRLIEDGFHLSQRMSWEIIANEYLLPGLARAQSAIRMAHDADVIYPRNPKTEQ
jgi:hypothetical protein